MRSDAQTFNFGPLLLAQYLRLFAFDTDNHHELLCFRDENDLCLPSCWQEHFSLPQGRLLVVFCFRDQEFSGVFSPHYVSAHVVGKIHSDERWLSDDELLHRHGLLR